MLGALLTPKEDADVPPDDLQNGLGVACKACGGTMAGRTGTAALAWQRGSQERLVPGPPRMRNVAVVLPGDPPQAQAAA